MRDRLRDKAVVDVLLLVKLKYWISVLKKKTELLTEKDLSTVSVTKTEDQLQLHYISPFSVRHKQAIFSCIIRHCM